MRGLLLCGKGDTEYDALYDLLASLYVIPAEGAPLLRAASFLKLSGFGHAGFPGACRGKAGFQGGFFIEGAYFFHADNAPVQAAPDDHFLQVGHIFISFPDSAMCPFPQQKGSSARTGARKMKRAS